jgi:hypothetical protein
VRALDLASTDFDGRADDGLFAWRSESFAVTPRVAAPIPNSRNRAGGSCEMTNMMKAAEL